MGDNKDIPQSEPLQNIPEVAQSAIPVPGSTTPQEKNKNQDTEQPSENIPEAEHSEIRPSSGKIISAEKITTATEEEPLKIKPLNDLNENMEVHHHTHPGHHKKKWTDYFWEFLMLFLAVFCGFLAEYQLEHQIENDREKQYMESMLEDLHRDTSGIQSVYELGLAQKAIMDTLLHFINNDLLSDNNISELYLKNLNSTRIVNIDFENRTASQLKNAGGMRLIRKKAVADSILGYWRSAEICDAISARLERIGESRYNIAARLFHNKYYILNDNIALLSVSGIKNGAKLISNDPELMAEYANRTFAKKAVLNNYLRRMLETKSKAVRLMGLINKQYHFN